jgi:hypothetical protein
MSQVYFDGVIDDDKLFDEIRTIKDGSHEIGSYIDNAYKGNIYTKQRILDIPNKVALGKIRGVPENIFANLLEKMKSFDWLLTATGDKYRSNSIHQIRVFLLGYFLLYKCGFKSKIERTTNYPMLDFVWLYASLFHDIGYLVEKLSDIQTSINEWTKDFQLFTILCSISLNEKNFDSISKTLKLLSGKHCLPIQKVFEGYRKKDHGIISALIVRDAFGNNWRDSFIVPGIQAMAMHNLIKKPILFDVNPLAFLLMLCDEIQEWDRPSRMAGHFQLINPIKNLHLTAKSDNTGKISLVIKYDFSSQEIINQLEAYEIEFINLLVRDSNYTKDENMWSEERFLESKCEGLNKKLKCGDDFDITFEVIKRDGTSQSIRSTPTNWFVDKEKINPLKKIIAKIH